VPKDREINRILNIRGDVRQVFYLNLFFETATEDQQRFTVVKFNRTVN